MEKVLFVLFMFIFLMFVFAGILASVFKNEILIEQRAKALFKNRMKNKKDKNRNEKEKHKKEKQSVNTIIKPMIKKSQKQIENRMSEQNSKSLERKLREAGYPFHGSPAEFRLVQIGLSLVIFLFIGTMYILSTNDFGKLLLFAILSGLFGIMLPQYYLQVRRRERIKQVQKQMADFFDMVNLSIEAGMGLDQAIMKVSKQNSGPVSEEFLRTLDEMKLGKSRREAFSDLRYRVPSDQFQSIMSSLIQADQLGIGMAKILKQLTIRIREHQRELAREQAMKAPIKMMFPMVFFIFPSLFIVLLGPLVIYLITVGLGG